MTENIKAKIFLPLDNYEILRFGGASVFTLRPPF